MGATPGLILSQITVEWFYIYIYIYTFWNGEPTGIPDMIKGEPKHTKYDPNNYKKFLPRCNTAKEAVEVSVMVLPLNGMHRIHIYIYSYIYI